MCPSPPRQTWSSNLNHTASQLFQVASPWADQRRLMWMTRKRLGSPSQVGQKSETGAWTPATSLLSYLCIDILSLYWFIFVLKWMFSPVVRMLFRHRKWTVSSPESCVFHKDNFNLSATCGVVILSEIWASFCSLATFCSDYSSAAKYPP